MLEIVKICDIKIRWEMYLATFKHLCVLNSNPITVDFFLFFRDR